MVTLLKSHQSQTTRCPPFGLGIIMIGAPNGEVLGAIRPLLKRSFRYFSQSSYSAGLIRLCLRYGGAAPSSNRMVCPIPRSGGKPVGRSSEKTCLYFSNSAWMRSGGTNPSTCTSTGGCCPDPLDRSGVVVGLRGNPGSAFPPSSVQRFNPAGLFSVLTPPGCSAF